MTLPQSNLEADKTTVRKTMKYVARNARSLAEQVAGVIDTVNALGIQFNAEIAGEGEASNALYAFSEIKNILTNHATNLAKAADIGDTIN